ncbi:alpha/beta hydrolase [Actinomyces minihominis]|uniref:alpha/beta hydrolase n=1 Tax=Actinomyces minihominis TaxID=2002838 RepID=UPI000C0896B8|nr:alpha/beta hydrolase [Actinomyces minihominis]
MRNRPNNPRLGEVRTRRSRGPASNEPSGQSALTDEALLDEATFDEAEARLTDIEDRGSIDVLAPWEEFGPPPTGSWGPDVLGEGFEAQTIPLQPDEEGELVATLVRQKPHEEPAGSTQTRSWMQALHVKAAKKSKPKFVMLHVHGRNDYFFHPDSAQKFSEMGAAFYALDLRKYGRSLRPWQTIGYTLNLADYDEEINAALDVIRQDHPGLPVFMIAHSMGGLVATLWAWRNPGVLSGLILNSAWLELQVHTGMRNAIHQVAKRVARIRPRAAIMGVSKNDYYFRSLASGWGGSGFDAPDYFAENLEDRANVGWKIIPEWKLPYSYPAPAAWVVGILEGHELVQDHVHLDCPVLAMASTNYDPSEEWTEAVFNSDVVLDADVITERAGNLSDSVTIARFPGKHDLLLSDPPVRRDIFTTISRWMKFIGEDD